MNHRFNSLKFLMAVYVVFSSVCIQQTDAQWEARFGAPAISPVTGETLNPSLIYDPTTGVLSIDNAGNNETVDSPDNTLSLGDDVGMISVVLSTAFDTGATSLLPVFEDGLLWSNFSPYFNGAIQLSGTYITPNSFLPISATDTPIIQLPTGLTATDFIGPAGIIDIEIGVNFGQLADGSFPQSVTLFPAGNPIQTGAFRVNTLSLGPGDFDTDADYDCQDVDSLVAEIVSGNNGSLFDLTGDGLVDNLDLDAWLTEAGQFNNTSGNPYFPGDANLDGVVDVGDFGVWNNWKFTNSAAWCEGDFNADGSTDASDFNVWNAHKFQSSDGVATVPEPSAVGILLTALIYIVFLRRHSS